MKTNEMLGGLYSREFVRARLATYGVVTGMLLLSTFAPLHYSCGGGSRCVGCGFRAALGNIVRLRLADAIKDNGLVLVVIVAFPVVLVDLVIMVTRRTRRTRLSVE